jgi:hypothetical protein
LLFYRVLQPVLSVMYLFVDRRNRLPGLPYLDLSTFPRVMQNQKSESLPRDFRKRQDQQVVMGNLKKHGKSILNGHRIHTLQSKWKQRRGIH